MSLEVDSAHQIECSMKVIRKGFRLLCFRLTKNVSCEDDRWVVETQLRKLRNTSDTLIWRACAIFQSVIRLVFVNLIYDNMVVDTQFHKFCLTL